MDRKEWNKCAANHSLCLPKYDALFHRKLNSATDVDSADVVEKSQPTMFPSSLISKRFYQEYNDTTAQSRSDPKLNRSNAGTYICMCVYTYVCAQMAWLYQDPNVKLYEWDSSEPTWLY